MARLQWVVVVRDLAGAHSVSYGPFETHPAARDARDRFERAAMHLGYRTSIYPLSPAEDLESRARRQS